MDIHINRKKKQKTININENKQKKTTNKCNEKKTPTIKMKS